MLWRIPADTHGQRIGTMARRGPFTTYKPEYCGLARNFCLLEESGLMLLTDNAALLSSFGKRKSKKPLDRTEQCCGVSLPTLT
jgi:hypothetical protein